ncbi:MAG: HD family hydrolase [Bauldia sp.]|nr:HD family hydrolase [Bauldia sp.]
MARKDSDQRAWQRMISGRRLDLVDPSPLDIEITDIAHGLARVARWNGQTVGAHAYSVAQHTLLVDDIAAITAPEIGVTGRLAVLLHDAPEYVIGDLISPFKVLLGGEYRAVEQRLLHAIHRRFGLPVPLPDRLTAKVKAADTIAAYFEAVRLAGFSETEALRYFGRPGGIDEAPLDLEPWSASVAERRFLKRFGQIEKAATKDHSRKA